MRGHELHAPAHLDAEVLSALGRLHRAQKLEEASVTMALRELRMAPIRRHALAELASGAWERRNRYRLVDGLYVELTEALGSVGFLATDAALARSFDRAELVADDG